MLAAHGLQDQQKFIEDETKPFLERLKKQKACLLQVKTDLGTPELMKLFKEESDKSQKMWEDWIAASDGKFINSDCLLEIKGITANQFADWFDKGIKSLY